MSTTLAPSRTSRQAKSHTSSNRFTSHRATFARSAVFDEFRARDARAIEQADFADRQPGDQCQRLDRVAEDVVEDLAQAARRHWLGQAARTDSPEERQAALEIAAEIARLAGIPLEEPFEEEAA